MLVSVPYLQRLKMVNKVLGAGQVLKDRLMLLFLRLLMFCEQCSCCTEVLVQRVGVQRAVPVLLTGKSTELKKHFHLAQKPQHFSTVGQVMFTALHPFLQYLRPHGLQQEEPKKNPITSNYLQPEILIQSTLTLRLATAKHGDHIHTSPQAPVPYSSYRYEQLFLQGETLHAVQVDYFSVYKQSKVSNK